MNSFVLWLLRFLNIIPPLQAGPLRKAYGYIFRVILEFDNNFLSIILKKLRSLQMTKSTLELSETAL